MRKYIVLIFIFLLSCYLQGQVDFASNVKDDGVDEKKQELLEIKRTVDVGAGFGLDYGGLIGFQVTYTPIKYLGVIVSAGYHLVSFGWQLGLKGYILPKTNLKRVRPTLKVMFGSNRAIVVDGASQYNKSYVGFTPGAGVELRFGEKKSHGLNIDLNFPISSSEFNNDYEALKNDPNIEITVPPAPVAFAIGYHFEF